MKHRDKKGRFARNFWPYKWFIISVSVGTIYTFSMIGVNNVWQYVRSFDRVFVVEGTQAEVIIIEPTLKEKIYAVAKKYGVSGYQMWRTVECETNFRNIQSEVVKNGIRENSWGYFQIHLISWPEVSKWEALNEDFAIKWAAEHWYTAKWYAYNRKTDQCVK